MSRLNARCLAQIFSSLIQEPPTLDLANDCSRFVAAYFEIIRASSPHIYHSALVMAPNTSIVRKLYESHSQHFARIVHGGQESWDPNIATTTFPFEITVAAWSPCNRFIATSSLDATRVDILDSATLQPLQSLVFPQERLTRLPVLIFSPNSRMLTYAGRRAHQPTPLSPYVLFDPEVFIVTWDLQTGGAVSAIEWKRPYRGKSQRVRITYSTDGKMVAILDRLDPCWVNISIFDVVSGVYMHDVDCRQLGGSRLCHIWTNGESVQFVTADSIRIAIWEVGFALGAASTLVESFPGPDDANDAIHFEFLPALCRAAFVHSNQILVWDARGSTPLLRCTRTDPLIPPAFSPDGRFFACSTTGSGAHLWEESPTGYIPHGNLSTDSRSLFSPDGKSIVVFGGSMVQLWHTNSFTTAASGASLQLPQHSFNFLLDFLPDMSLAVVARRGQNTVTVLDLKFGILRLTIDTPMKIRGIRLIGNAVVVIGGGKAITWALPLGGNTLPDARMNVKDSAQTVGFCNPARSVVLAASISLDSRYIALAGFRREGFTWFLEVHCKSTGRVLRFSAEASALWFAPGGREIWCATETEAKLFTITQDALRHTKTVADVEDGSWGCPWGSSCDYRVTNDGWILGLGGKRLLMLPPPWQAGASRRVWSGQFLALLHRTLPEPVIIELEP